MRSYLAEIGLNTHVVSLLARVTNFTPSSKVWIDTVFAHSGRRGYRHAIAKEHFGDPHEDAAREGFKYSFDMPITMIDKIEMIDLLEYNIDTLMHFGEWTCGHQKHKVYFAFQRKRDCDFIKEKLLPYSK